MQEMNSQVIIDILEVLEKHKLIPPTQKRNEIIKIEFKKLKDSGVGSTKAIEELSACFNLSTKSIEFVVYGDKKK